MQQPLSLVSRFFFLSPRKIFYFISNGPRAFSVHASTAALFRSQRPDRRSASSINHLFFLSSTTFLLNKSWWKVPAFFLFYFIFYLKSLKLVFIWEILGKLPCVCTIKTRKCLIFSGMKVVIFFFAFPLLCFRVVGCCIVWPLDTSFWH